MVKMWSSFGGPSARAARVAICVVERAAKRSVPAAAPIQARQDRPGVRMWEFLSSASGVATTLLFSRTIQSENHLWITRTMRERNGVPERYVVRGTPERTDLEASRRRYASHVDRSGRTPDCFEPPFPPLPTAN